MKTTVVHCRKEPYDVYIGRPGSKPSSAFGTSYRQIFGNPFTVRDHGRAGCIERFKTYFLDRVATDAKFREEVLKLKGKRLGCFCKPDACHGDIIADWLDGGEQ